jgi:hypothetical protein
MGDPIADFLSIIVTRDGGNTWNKLPADKLPRTANGEAAFAASNTNIVIKGNNTWIVSGGMKARFSILQIKGILGKYTIRQLYKEKRWLAFYC